MSRDRIFHLADLIVKQLESTPSVVLKAPDDLRPEIVRVLTEEAKLEESIDTEVRRILSTYARPATEGSHEWDVIYQKTRDEVFKRRRL